jgi:glycerol uptake facilitator-like aquaporin
MQEYVVEFLGTVFFLYVIIATGHPVAIGAALAVSIYLGGPSSGGNFNPAVTILMALTGKQSVNTVAPYIVAQLLGALTVQQIYKRLHR